RRGSGRTSSAWPRQTARAGWSRTRPAAWRTRTSSSLRLAMSEPDVDALELGVGLDLLEVLLPADAAVLDAAERCPEEVPGRLVHPHVAGVHVTGKGQRGAQVAGEDARGEPVLDAVGDGDRLVVAVERDRGQDRSEDL